MLPSMHGHVIWHITYHRCMVMSYDTSPIIDAWSYHLIHHLPSMHGRFMIHHLLSMHSDFMSYDASPTIDASSCHVIHHLPSMHCHIIWYITYYRCMSCHMIHHLLSMHGQHHRWEVMYHITWPCIDGRWCIIWHDHASMVGDVSHDMTMHRC